MVGRRAHGTAQMATRMDARSRDRQGFNITPIWHHNNNHRTCRQHTICSRYDNGLCRSHCYIESTLTPGPGRFRITWG